jgi:hypothetical protein
MVKRRKREKKDKYVPVYRTKEERQAEARKIIDMLTNLQLTSTRYEPVKTLFEKIRFYINEGVRQEINIPFASIERRIKGVLAINVREEVWVKLETEKF